MVRKMKFHGTHVYHKTNRRSLKPSFERLGLFQKYIPECSATLLLQKPP